MATVKVQQLRFYNLGNTKNFPLLENTSISENPNFFWTNNVLENIGPIVKLGIQTLPGVKFSLNGNMVNKNTLLTIDHTGLYELDLTNVSASITTLSFDAASLILINSLDNASLIVDVAYYVADSKEE